MILLTFQPQIAWQTASPRLSAKADNLITAVQTRKLLDVDVHPDLRVLMEYRALLSTWCKTFLHTREKEVFFLNTLKICLAPVHQEGPFQVMFVGTQQPREQKNLNTRERKGQDATKKTSESRIQCLWLVMADFDDSADVDGEKHSQPKHHRAFHQGDR